MSHDSDFTGRLQVQPPLNEDERDHLLDLLDAEGTLRGTPTGRGDRDVPFARLAWVACADGCCLEWDPGLEDARWMVATLRFVIDHLLRPGAKAEGRGRFSGFTFDHVVTGVAVGRPDDAGTLVLVQVDGNELTTRTYDTSCSAERPFPSATDPFATAPRVTADNVVAFRPRGA